MGVDDVGVVELPAAERVCSVVVAAGSLTVATGGRCWELTGAHALHGGGRLLLLARDRTRERTDVIQRRPSQMRHKCTLRACVDQVLNVPERSSV
jgi:hypothetical protein